MDPEKSLKADKSRFDADLAALIDQAAANARSSTDPRLRKKRPAPVHQQDMSKRSKINEDAASGEARAASIFAAPPSPRSQSHVASQWSAAQSANLSISETFRSKPASLNIAKRSRNPRDNGLSYDTRVEQRRPEHIAGVDRYVPPPGQIPPTRAPTTNSRRPLDPTSINGVSAQSRSFSSRLFPFDRLHEDLKKRILRILLVKSHEPILLDHTWLRPFIKGHSRVPDALVALRAEDGSTFSVPKGWNTLLHEVQIMQRDCAKITNALEERGIKTRSLESPCRGMTPGVLRVSKELNRLGTSIFYGQNTFRFPHATSAWMELESFLATIGPENVARLSSILVHVPLWHRSVQEDYVEGAILDLTSPASRLGVIQPVAHDRLLSAIKASVRALLGARALASFNVDLEHGMSTDRWTGRYVNARHLVPLADADESVGRKQRGVDSLKELSQLLGKAIPVLTLHHPSLNARIQNRDLSEFRLRLPGVIQEASKYGWKVDQRLKQRRW